jgi:hypothetical protein
MKVLLTMKEMAFILDKNPSAVYKDWLMSQNKTKMGQLYKGILKNKWNDDDDAAAKDLDYKSSQDAGYRKLKSLLVEKLYELFLYIKIPSKNLGKESELEFRLKLQNKMVAWQNLSLMGANRAFGERAEELYREAKTYQITRIQQTILYQLIGIKTIFDNKEKFDFYQKEIKYIERCMELEHLGKKHLSNISQQFSNTKASKPHLFEAAEKDYQHFLQEAEGYNSPLIIAYHYLLKIYVYSIVNKHHIVFETAKAAYDYFNNEKIIRTETIKTFNYYLIQGYTKQKNYALAKYHSEENLRYVEESSNAWFKSMELYAFAALHLGEYEDAALLWHKATNHSVYSNISPLSHDTFSFIFAHLHFLKEIGIFEPQDKALKAIFDKPLKFQKFVNDLEIGTLDKKGLAIVQILLEVAFLLVRKNDDGIFERMEAVEKYFQRHSEVEGHERILAFFNLIKLGIKHYWKRELIETEGKPHFEILATTDNSLANQRIDMEFIPYDHYIDLLVINFGY